MTVCGWLTSLSQCTDTGHGGLLEACRPTQLRGHPSSYYLGLKLLVFPPFQDYLGLKLLVFPPFQELQKVIAQAIQNIAALEQKQAGDVLETIGALYL